MYLVKDSAIVGSPADLELKVQPCKFFICEVYLNGKVTRIC